MPQKIKLGHSPDADDAFMFYAMAKNKVNLRGYTFEHNLRDIQTLNEWGKEGRLDMTAFSVYGYGQLADKYLIVPYGISMGEKYGPILVAKKPMTPDQIKGKRIAIPGSMTTAYLVFKIFFPEFEAVMTPFEKILDAVSRDEVDAGLLIHEGQLTFKRFGMQKVLDLGELWFEKTGIPLPLGINAIKRELEPQAIKDVCEILKESIHFAMGHREDALEYALPFSRGLQKDVADRFVGMYVNQWSEELGDKGRQAIQLLLDKAYESKMLPNKVKAEFA